METMLIRLSVYICHNSYFMVILWKNKNKKWSKRCEIYQLMLVWMNKSCLRHHYTLPGTENKVVNKQILSVWFSHSTKNENIHMYIYIYLSFFTYMTPHPTLTYPIPKWQSALSTYKTQVLDLNQKNWTLISSFFSSSEVPDQNCSRNRNRSQNWRKTRRRRKGWSCHRCHCCCLQTRKRSSRSRCCPRKSRWKSWTNHYCCCWSWRRTYKKTACARSATLHHSSPNLGLSLLAWVNLTKQNTDHFWSIIYLTHNCFAGQRCKRCPINY